MVRFHLTTEIYENLYTNVELHNTLLPLHHICNSTPSGDTTQITAIRTTMSKADMEPHSITPPKHLFTDHYQR